MYPAWWDFIKQSNAPDDKEDEILSQTIWVNDNIRVGNKPVYYGKWYKKGIKNINDFIDGNGKYISFENFKHKYDININILLYFWDGIRYI